MRKKLRCPFCGSFPCIKENEAMYGTIYTIRCTNEGCVVRPSATDVDKDRLIDTWNTRYNAAQIYF